MFHHCYIELLELRLTKQLHYLQQTAQDTLARTHNPTQRVADYNLKLESF